MRWPRWATEVLIGYVPRLIRRERGLRWSCGVFVCESYLAWYDSYVVIGFRLKPDERSESKLVSNPRHRSLV